MGLFVILIAASALPAIASAELPVTLDCVEVVHAEANEQLTSYKSRRDEPAFSLTFARSGEGWAMVGNLGVGYIDAIDGVESVTLIEKTPWGTLNVTAIGKRARNGVYKAVHSRHTIPDGNFAPSQYLLDCNAR